MAQFGKRDQLSDAPKFQVDDKNHTGQQLYGNTTIGVFGVDAVETGVTKGVAHQGWVKRTVGSGGRSGRIQYETLAAMSGGIVGDATSFSNASSANVANSTGTADDTVFPDS